MTKVTTAQRNVLEVMANGETIFTDYRGKFKLDNKTVSTKTLELLLAARLIQYEKMVRGVQTYSITEAGRSIVTPIAELVAKIAASLNTYGINPTFNIANGNVAKASKWFDEARNREMFSVGYYEEGSGLYLTAEFASFEALIERMKDLSGDLGLWEISKPAAASQPGSASADEMAQRRTNIKKASW